MSTVDYINPADSIEWMDHQRDFTVKVRRWCNKNKIDFFGTYESIILDSKSTKLVKYTFELVESFDNLMHIDIKLGKSGKHLFYLTDNIVDTTQTIKFKNITVIPIIELLGIFSLPKIKKPTQPSRLFNCFIQRVDSVRQSWFYFLKKYNLLDKGFVSFLLFQYDFYSDKRGLELFDWIHTHHELNKLPHFEQAYHELRPHVPYKNFPEVTDLNGYAADSKYSLVLDTYAIKDMHIGYIYTEKLIRALQTPTVNLLFSQQHSLSVLEKLGFKIDNFMLQIDKLPWVKRQQKLLDVLVKDLVAFDPDLLYNNALHNQALILKYKQEFLKGQFFEKIFTDIINK